jgi:hypothetical protein
MNQSNKITRRIAKIIPALGMAFLTSCGDYTVTTPSTSQQPILRMSGYPALSGRPALRTPSSIGILTTRRTDTLDFGNTSTDLTKNPKIRSMQSLSSIVPIDSYYQLNDVLTQRAKLIHDAKFLGLDIILVCDQLTDTSRNPSFIQVATLGIVDLGMRKQNTQLTVLAMDARTGYIYGVMGQQEDGLTPRLALFDANLFGDPNRSRFVTTTRKDAVKQFSAFWDQIVEKYQK